MAFTKRNHSQLIKYSLPILLNFIIISQPFAGYSNPVMLNLRVLIDLYPSMIILAYFLKTIGQISSQH